MKDWIRKEYRNIPIYFRPDEPNWFVPNKAGDQVLQNVNHNNSVGSDYDIVRFLERLSNSSLPEYRGRMNHMRLDRLNELWFHVTNRCNLSCSHCLFSSCPGMDNTLHADSILKLANEAHSLGCRVFVLTGGEPFVHPDAMLIIHELMLFGDSHVIVLTNGMNLPDILVQNRLDPERFHLQISVDGLSENHDRIRGTGTYEKLLKTLEWLQGNEFPHTLSMCITRKNVQDMPAIVDLASNSGASNVHFMWYFIRGRGQKENFVSMDTIFENLILAAQRAKKQNVLIDNIESIKTQIFAPPGTIHDGTTGAWESLAIGPDGRLYPSAALIGFSELSTNLNQGLEEAWRKSPVLEKIRECTAAVLPSSFRFILGGGDMDHSYVHKGTLMGDDPYHSLYEKTVLWLISEEISQEIGSESPQILLQMGEILKSCGAHGRVALVHSNCLLAAAEKGSLTTIKDFYTEAVGDKKEEILNPVCYDDVLIEHIPKEYRFRGYGCGSPVLDADISEGDRIVDLGCGSGVECFIAARITGGSGQVIGVDMLEPMLELARKGCEGVSVNLGFHNMEFKKGYLEDLPVEDDSVDVVLSNCVMNLSTNKRRAYAEILRILRPGGRLVISDVVCRDEPDPAIRNDESLRGECIAGALTEKHLMALLEETGFTGIGIRKRFPYRTVQGHPFFSLTYSASKPKKSDSVQVMYRGPMPHVRTHSGITLPTGIIRRIPEQEAELLGEQVFVMDEDGNVTNTNEQNTCACFVSPEEAPVRREPKQRAPLISNVTRMSSGCMVCGAGLQYFSGETRHHCAFCGNTFSTNSLCENGHFVCDSCHGEDGLKVIRHICTVTQETDMIRLFQNIREHPSIPVNGPEHHALVPGVILATYSHLGGDLPISTIETGIKRGSSVAGGYCAFMGICGAAVGVGIAFSLILDSNPLKPDKRKIVQSVTNSVLGEIAAFEAARCCQRDSFVALNKAAELSEKYLPIALKAEDRIKCVQKKQNKECLGRTCPMY